MNIFHLYFDEASKMWNEARGGGESVGTLLSNLPYGYLLLMFCKSKAFSNIKPLVIRGYALYGSIIPYNI